MPPRIWLLVAFRGWGAKATAPSGPRQLKTGVVPMSTSILEICHLGLRGAVPRGMCGLPHCGGQSKEVPLPGKNMNFSMDNLTPWNLAEMS